MKILKIEYCHQCKHFDILKQIELPRGLIKNSYGCKLTGKMLRYDQQEFPSQCPLEDVKE